MHLADVFSFVFWHYVDESPKERGFILDLAVKSMAGFGETDIFTTCLMHPLKFRDCQIRLVDGIDFTLQR